MVCHNPLLAEKRARKREDMLVATELELAKVAAMVERGAASGRGGLQGAAAIGERVGRVINKYQMAKHFTRSITDTSFTYVRDEESIGEEAALDGLYVLRTNVDEEQLDTAGVVLAYKEPGPRGSRPSGTSSSATWRYAPSTTTPSLECGRTSCCACWPTGYNGRCSGRWRPCSSWMRRHRRGPTRWRRHLASETVLEKYRTQRTADGFPVHSFRTLLADLGTMVKNRVILTGVPEAPGFDQVTVPTQLQARALELLQLPINPL